MIGRLQPEFAELIRQRDFNQLRDVLGGFPAPNIAETFGDFNPDDEVVLLRILPPELATEGFEYLSVDEQEKLVAVMGLVIYFSIAYQIPHGTLL